VNYGEEFSWLTELKGANTVIDALGKDVAAELVEVLIDSLLLPYHARGRHMDGDLYSLQKEVLEQRWDELYRMLGACSSVSIRSLISVEWNLPFACYVAFCTRTTEHLRVLLNTEVRCVKLLGDSDRDQRQDHVTMLVQVLESVLNIENEVHKMFDKGVYTLFGAINAATDTGSAGGIATSGRRLSAAGSRKYASPHLKRPSSVNAVHRCALMSTLVSEHYFDPYVQCERRNAEDALQDLVREDVSKSIPKNSPSSETRKGNKHSKHKNIEQHHSNSNSNNNSSSHLSEKELAAYTASCLAVYDSAVVLFQITRSSMLRCAALSNGKPLMSLLLEYKVMFQIYAEMLRNMLCPSLPPSAADAMSATRKQHTPHPLLLWEEIMACRAIMTADQCIGLIPQLEAEMLHKMSDQYKEDVHMHFQCELFEDVISHAIDQLVSSLLGKVDDAALVHMANTNWAKFTIVGDVSPYVFFLARTLSDTVPRLRSVLPADYFDTLCRRFSSDLMDHFLALLLGLRALGVAGAQQMLLDVNELTPILLSLHAIESSATGGGGGGGAGTSSSALKHSPTKCATYIEMVNRKSALLSTVLKLVLSDDKQIDETFHVLWPEGQAADLKLIKKLKSKDNSLISSLRDTDLNQYLDRRSFMMDESAYSTSPKGVMGTLTSAFGSIKRIGGGGKKHTT
jgi:hypothetical protein